MIDSSDYENDDDGQYEEVGFDDYDEDEGEVLVPPVAAQSLAVGPNGQPGGLAYGSASSQKRSSLILGTPLNELKENVKETDGEDEDDDYSDDAVAADDDSDSNKPLKETASINDGTESSNNLNKNRNSLPPRKSTDSED